MRPSGRFPSDLSRPDGSLAVGMLAAQCRQSIIIIIIIIIIVIIIIFNIVLTVMIV